MAGTNAPDLRMVGGREDEPEDLMGEYLATLGRRSVSTVEAYGRILRSLAGWVAERPGRSAGFRPELLTRTAVETYLKDLNARGYSVSHRSRVKSVASGFAGWLIGWYLSLVHRGSIPYWQWGPHVKEPHREDGYGLTLTLVRSQAKEEADEPACS